MLNMSLLDISSPQLAMRYGLSQMGVYISDFPIGSNPEVQGFQVGDCILAIHNIKITSITEIKSLLQNYVVGDTLSLNILRGTQQIILDLILTEYKPSL